MRHPGFRAQFVTFVLAMMADNIEHVISYWMVFQKFHSPALAGFAIVSHWLPYLLFSVASGALAERFDPRRVIQVGMTLFIIASLSWSYFFVTDTLQMWQAMVILVIHGCAGVLWQTPNQMLLYDIVGPSDLESAVRLNAMARYLAVLVGPAVGGAILLALGPSVGIMLNTVFYLPLVLWLVNAPYGPRYRTGAPAPRRAVRGLGDIVETVRDIRNYPVIVSMTLLAGAASFFVGNAYSSQMPGFASDLGHGDPGVSYSLLLAADAAGGLLAGVVLEGRGLLPPRPRTAIVLAILWCIALAIFSRTGRSGSPEAAGSRKMPLSGWRPADVTGWSSKNREPALGPRVTMSSAEPLGNPSTSHIGPSALAGAAASSSPRKSSRKAEVVSVATSSGGPSLSLRLTCCSLLANRQDQLCLTTNRDETNCPENVRYLDNPTHSPARQSAGACLARFYSERDAQK